MTYSDSIKLTMSSSEEIGKAIQKQRRAQKITQKEFAQRLGKSERTIQKYESGEILLKIDVLKQIANELKGQKLIITDVKKTRKKELPPLLYDLTELQRDANKRFGYSAKQTLNIMQSLYETHKLLTYPRTDSRYISDDIIPTLKERLQSISIDVYEPFAQKLL